MIERRILAKLLDVEELPTLPEVMNQILETVADEDSSAQDVTELLERDHAISARVLRMANSAFYGLRHTVDSIRRAVVVIGFDAVRQLALATAVFDTLASRKQFALDPDDFWMHSLGTAKAVQVLCKKHCKVDSPEGSFTAGLLHDIGKYVLALVLKEEYVAIVQEAQATERPLRDIELERLETSHEEVGQWVANRWGLPTRLSEALGNLYRAGTYTGVAEEEVRVVALGDHISRIAEFGVAGDWAPPSLDPPLLAAMDIKRATISEIAEELAGFRDDTRQFLEALGRP